MTREKIKKITEEFDNYFTAIEKSEPLVYLYGEEKDDEDYVKKVKPLSITSQNSVQDLLKVMQSYSERVKKYIDGELDLKDLEKDDDNSGLFFKPMDAEDLANTN